MKNYLLGIFLLLCSSYLQAQDSIFSQKHIFSLGINEGVKTFVGDNFISKSYKASLFTGFDVRIRIYENIGVGGLYEYSKPSIKSFQYIGNSSKSKMKSWNWYLFYNISWNKKWLFVPKIGMGSYALINYLNANDFYQTYSYKTKGNTYFVAPELNYFIDKHFTINMNIQYGYIKLTNMNANESAIGTNYNHTNQWSTSIGVRFWL